MTHFEDRFMGLGSLTLQVGVPKMDVLSGLAGNLRLACTAGGSRIQYYNALFFAQLNFIDVNAYRPQTVHQPAGPPTPALPQL